MYKNYFANDKLELLFYLAMAAVTLTIGVLTVALGNSLNSLNTRAETNWYTPTQKQGTFDFTQITPIPTVTTTQVITKLPEVAGPLPTGGAVSKDAPVYCIDDEDPDGCDDNTAFHVPKGVGGATGSCGTIIEQAHKLVNSLPQDIKLDGTKTRDSLNPAVSNCSYSTGTYSGGYISTFFVIDAYNLAGITDLSKNDPAHVSGTNLLNWWKSQPPGYVFIPYHSTVIEQYGQGQLDLTGCVMFFNLSSGVHVGIVNTLQLVTSGGDGVISILQSGAKYFLDRFEVIGWNIVNTPLHQTQLSSMEGFGCHQ